MARAASSYHVVESEGLPWSLAVPESKVEDEDWLEGAATLSAAAVRSYNASVERLHRKDIPGAVAHAERALELMPYSPHLLEYTATLATVHGDFDLAARVYATAQRLGLDDLATTIRSDIKGRVEDWNEAVDDPQRWVGRYDSGMSLPGYRELLLIDSLGSDAASPALKEQLIAHGIVTEPSTRSNVVSERHAKQRGPLAIALVLLIAVVIGGAGGWVVASVPGEGDDEARLSRQEEGEALVGQAADGDAPLGEGRPGGDESAAGTEGTSAVSIRALQALASGEVSRAAALVVEAEPHVDDEGIAAVGMLVSDELVEAAEGAWGRRQYERVVSKLTPLVSMGHVRRPEGLYYLGVAADETGADSLAVRALARYIDDEASAGSPHYRAQAAYTLARLGDGPAAIRAARVIADEFPGTIYYNSVIRERLSDGNYR